MKKYLIAGLGNIGEEYAQTRHNIGFKILDVLARTSNTSFSPGRYADVAKMKLKNKELVLIKPTTYMNLSGKAINYWLQHERIPLENLLVVVDELALPFGAIRIKTKGSDGGHNGLKSVQEVLATSQYSRLRFGIGNDFPKGQQVNFVLSPWSETELKALDVWIEKATEAIKTFVLAGPNHAMNAYNKS